MDVRSRPAASGRLPAAGALVLVLVCVLLLAGPGAASGRAPSGRSGAPSGAASRAGAGVAGGWVWPLSGPPPVVRGFDPPDVRWEPGHRGVDLLAEPGAIVRAAGGGVVSFAGPLAGRGVVSVRHRDGTRTTYQPLAVAVVRGDRVEAGHPLGRLSAAGGHCPPQACLHWGRLRGDVYLDPLSLLGRGPVRLLPVWGPVDPPAAARAPGTSSAEAAERPTGIPDPAAAPGAPTSGSGWRLTAAAGAGGVGLAALVLLVALRPARRGRRVGRGRTGPPPPGVVDLAVERSRRRRDHPRVIA